MTPLHAHFAGQLKGILRPPAGVLKHPFLVPGGLYHDEPWDWDNFCVARGFFALREELEPAPFEEPLAHAVSS